MNILAVDYGEKRIGLAWCQVGLDLVLPFGIVKTLNELVTLIKKEKIDKVIVGSPLGMAGQENTNSKKIKEFVVKLKELVNIEVELVDERFTSQQADRMGGQASRDEKSAMVILQSYLEKK